MYKSILLSSLFAVAVYAAGYGGGYGGGLVGDAFLGGGLGLAGGPGPLLDGGPGLIGPAHGAPGPLAIFTQQHVKFVDTPSHGHVHPTNVFVDSLSSPVNLVFRSHSAPVHVEHHHAPAPGSHKATESQDEPHVRVHTVTKPVINEVREIILPQRIVRQEVMPVREQIETQVARHVGAGPILAAGPAGPGPLLAGGPAGPGPLLAGGPAGAGPLLGGGFGGDLGGFGLGLGKCAGGACGGALGLAGPGGFGGKAY